MTSQTADITRDYTIHLRVTHRADIDTDILDEAVTNIVDASSARDAIQMGLDYSGLTRQFEDAPELKNLYVVSATRPQGGIE